MSARKTIEILAGITTIVSFAYVVWKDYFNRMENSSSLVIASVREDRFHLGDEDLSKLGWPDPEDDREDRCFEQVISLDGNLNNLHLEYQAVGLEKATLKVNEVETSFPSQPTTSDHPKRPNYPSGKKFIKLPANAFRGGENRILICPQPVENPDHSMDVVDDFLLEKVRIVRFL